MDLTSNCMLELYNTEVGKGIHQVENEFLKISVFNTTFE